MIDFKVKPRRQTVRDVVKKVSNDLRDPAGIFMGESKSFLFKFSFPTT